MGANPQNTVNPRNQTDPQTVFHLRHGDGGKRVLILGNSITLHGTKADIGWHGNYGMAASCAENDYVHRLAAMLKGENILYDMRIRQAAEWEVSLAGDKTDLRIFDGERDFCPDIIIYRLAENISASVEKDFYIKRLRELLDYTGRGKSRIIFTTSFWKHPKLDDGTEELAHEFDMPLIYLGDLGSDESMTAIGKFSHSGVACHPGDKGMLAIAERIFPELKALILV